MADGDSTTSIPEADVNKELGFGSSSDDRGGSPTPMVLPGQQVPPSQPDPSDQPKGPEDQVDERLKEQDRLYHENLARAEKAGETYRSNYDRVQEIEAQYRAQAQVQPPKLQQPLTFGQFEEQQQQAQAQLRQQQGRNPYTMIGNIVSLAAVGMAVFGHSRNPWANAALMSGAGAFMNNFAKGQTEAGKEQLELWNKNNEEIQKQNKEETEDYHNVLANRHLSLAEQHALIAELSAQRQDWKMYAAAAQQNINEELKILNFKNKAYEFYAKTHVNVVQQVINNYLQKTEKGKSWAAWVVAKTNGKVNPAKSTEEFLKAYNDDKLSPGAWAKEVGGASIDTEEKKGETTAGEGTATEKGSDGNYGSKDHPLSSDAEINALPQGAHFWGPDGLAHIKSW